jgi:hypothetical protein
MRITSPDEGLHWGLYVSNMMAVLNWGQGFTVVMTEGSRHLAHTLDNKNIYVSSHGCEIWHWETRSITQTLAETHMRNTLLDMIDLTLALKILLRMLKLSTHIQCVVSIESLSNGVVPWATIVLHTLSFVCLITASGNRVQCWIVNEEKLHFHLFTIAITAKALKNIMVMSWFHLVHSAIRTVRWVFRRVTCFPV